MTPATMTATAATAATATGVAAMSVAPEAYLVVGTILFAIGLAGALLKRNALSIFLSVELMMNAVNLLFLAYARMRADAAGQMVVFFVIAISVAVSSSRCCRRKSCRSNTASRSCSAKPG